MALTPRCMPVCPLRRPEKPVYLTIGERIREVYHSTLQFDGREPEWHFGRALGAGTFGMVAEWDKKGEGVTVDVGSFVYSHRELY